MTSPGDHPSVWDDAPLPYQSLTADGMILAVNSPWEQLTGYSAADVIGTPYQDLVPETHREQFHHTALMMLVDGRADGVPCLVRAADGRDIHVKVYGRVSQGDDGVPITRCMLVDMSAEHDVETVLAETEARYQALFELAPNPIVIHDGASVLMANLAAARFFGFESAETAPGRRIIDFVHPDSVDAVRNRVHAMMTQGATVPMHEAKYLRVDGSTVCGVTIARPVRMGGRDVIHAVLLDVSEQRNVEEALHKSKSEIARYRDQLEELLEERTRSLYRVRAELKAVTAVISRTVEIRDPYTAGHQRRVASLACAIAQRMGLSDADIDEITVAATLHDIGKVSVPAEILSKPAVLSPIEIELVKTHSQAGFEIISSAELDGPIAELVYQHHERLDGSGYPRGLKGEELLPGALIIGVSDVVEAMTSHRPYRAALGYEVAVDEVRRHAGSLYDPEVVEACASVIDEGFLFEALV